MIRAARRLLHLLLAPPPPPAVPEDTLSPRVQSALDWMRSTHPQGPLERDTFPPLVLVPRERVARLTQEVEHLQKEILVLPPTQE